MSEKKLFCDINPMCYAISLQKEIIKRHVKDFFGKDRFAKTKREDKLPNVITSHRSDMIKRGPGIDPVLQTNKAVNINLAGSKLNGLVIHPGEVFSFWKTVGKITKKKGYLDGRVIKNNKIIPDIGGGLCNLGNTVHLLFLHSPLDVIEIHHHSDALAPDAGKRVPYSAGTSVSYNNIDYRVKNNTSQDVQLCIWCEGDFLNAELRSEKDIPYSYEIIEEGHHFAKEGDKYYRISKIYRLTKDKASDKVLEKKLIWDNHSKVMFDYDLIPRELIK